MARLPSDSFLKKSVVIKKRENHLVSSGEKIRHLIIYFKRESAVERKTKGENEKIEAQPTCQFVLIASIVFFVVSSSGNAYALTFLIPRKPINSSFGNLCLLSLPDSAFEYAVELDNWIFRLFKYCFF